MRIVTVPACADRVVAEVALTLLNGSLPGGSSRVRFPRFPNSVLLNSLLELLYSEHVVPLQRR